MVHEWALAEAIIKKLEEVAKGSPVSSAVIAVGELQSVDIEILTFAIDELKKGTKLENVLVQVEKEPAELECSNCEHRWAFGNTGLGEEEKEAIHYVPELVHAFVRCPKCGSPDFRIVQGRGVWIKAVELGG
ncbi:MAG: hydrogenase nickel incorporation protein HypA [Thermofilaceae archaeon]